MKKTYKIETVYTLKQPLSHIGDNESTCVFLNTVRIVHEGTPVDVFAYTGNAIRGQWRDSGAAYLLDRLEIAVPKKTFHLLFSGGSIGDRQQVDVEAAKQLRRALPFLSMFGGGVGNQILAGKMSMSFAFPVCKETVDFIPMGIPHINYDAQAVSWKKLTGEIQFSRKDDAKAELGDVYMLKTDREQMLLEGEKKGKKKSDDEGPATQMRYAVEYLMPGVQLWHTLTTTCSELELGALVASIHEWAQNPVLGGMSGKGFGLVDAIFEIIDEYGKRDLFIQVNNGRLALSPVAEDAKEQYDMHIKSIYEQYILADKNKFIAMLEGGGRE